MPAKRDIEGELDELRDRVAELESARPAQAPPPGADGKWWLLERLARNSGPEFESDEAAGSLAYGGSVTTPGSGSIVWQLEHPLPQVLAADLDAASEVLAALGNPLRLEILRRLLLGARTLGDLAEIPGSGTSGQLHHHLRELRSAGLVVSRRRNDYAIPAERVVPVLVIVAAALGRELAAGEQD